jgi:cell division protein FtsB
MEKENRSRQAVVESQKRRRFILLAVAGFFAVYFIFSFIFGDAGILSYFRMEKKQGQLNHEIEELRQKNAELKNQIGLLRSDPHYIEQIAREQLGLVKDGETIYQFQLNDSP